MAPAFTWAGTPSDTPELPRFTPRPESGQGQVEDQRCRFLRTITPDGTLADPLATPVPYHRCAAFGDPLPLSLRQQELVCLQRVHVSCPRYLRGSVLEGEKSEPEGDQEKSRPGLIGLIALGLVVMAIWILLAGPVLGVLPFFGGGSNSTGPVATASPSAPASVAASVTPLPSATSAPPSASPKPSVSIKPTAAPSATWPPGATASRMNLVTPCTDGTNCFIYIVRGPGAGATGNGSAVVDTLSGICTYFGVDIDKVRALNPSLATSDVLTPGQQLRIPPPTR